MNKKLLMEHKQRKLLSKRLITLLENDRRQLAMELHDHVGQMLTTLKMDLEVVLGEVKPDGAVFKESTQLAHDKALQAMEEIRNIARGLRPTTLDTLGLASSLRELFDDIKEHTDLEIHFFHKRLPRRLDPEKELAIYRIVQEALTNVVKHAHAEKVFVNLVREKKFITLGVEDAGVGFDKDKVMKISRGKGPLGLLIMQERAVQVDGEFSIESRIDGGTHLLARIPV
jgi:signal transduction histidine kinase